MSARGQKPKPSYLRAIQGNPSRRTFNKQEPKPKLEKPRKPHGMSKGAQKLWDQLMPKLYDSHMVSVVDVEALRSCCEEGARYYDAVANLEKYGALIKKQSWAVPSPYISIANKSGQAFRQWLIEFGMTPSSRTRVNAQKGEEGEFDEF